MNRRNLPLAIAMVDVTTFLLGACGADVAANRTNDSTAAAASSTASIDKKSCDELISTAKISTILGETYNTQGVGQSSSSHCSWVAADGTVEKTFSIDVMPGKNVSIATMKKATLGDDKPQDVSGVGDGAFSTVHSTKSGDVSVGQLTVKSDSNYIVITGGASLSTDEEVALARAVLN